MLCPMPSLDYDASSQDQYLVSWYNLQLDGSRDEKLLTFHCHTGGWYLQIPTLWQEHLVLTTQRRGRQPRSATAFCGKPAAALRSF